MSNFFFRLISRPTTRTPSPAIAPPRHLLDPTRDAAELDRRRSLTIVMVAAIVLLLGASLGLEGCDQRDEGSPSMEFGESEAQFFPGPMVRCAYTPDGNSDSRMLKSACTGPRPEDPDAAKGANQ